MNIGIIGYGIVGKAIEAGFRDNSNIYIYDPAYPQFCGSSREVAGVADVIFVAVPTPMKTWTGGAFDSAIIDGVVCNLVRELGDRVDQVVVVIESAVIPAKVCEYLNDYPRLRLVISPEFLTDKESTYRFLNPESRILGGNPIDTELIQSVYERFSICKPCRVGYCDAVGAAVLKYMENCYLALKVSFMNQFYDVLIASGSSTPWQHLAEIFHYDSRMGNSHYMVPGHDGDRGWGGKCFPKDVNAICSEARRLGYPLTLMEEAWKYNLSIRQNIDWCNIKGAVSD